MKLPEIKWPEDGLIPVVIQEDDSDTVLMTGFMNELAMESTLATGEVHFWSRSRAELWHKGGSSGHVQRVRSVAVNCDLNSLLIRVQQVGGVCHDGYATCYYRDLTADGEWDITQNRLFDPRDVYGDGHGLGWLTRQWWGAYEWLRDHDLSHESSTSRLLRDESTSVLPRIQDELRELAGVLDGSHVHSDQQSDVILEASQCLYWIAVESIRTGFSIDQVQPGSTLDVVQSTVSASTAAMLINAEASALTSFSPGVAMHLIGMVAESVKSLGVEPRTVIEKDLDDLRSRRYLTEYFAR